VEDHGSVLVARAPGPGFGDVIVVLEAKDEVVLMRSFSRCYENMGWDSSPNMFSARCRTYGAFDFLPHTPALAGWANS